MSQHRETGRLTNKSALPQKDRNACANTAGIFFIRFIERFPELITANQV
jgi:hypothetical protein